MGKYLIVNADDYNTDRERNRGIIQAARGGIVTSTTIISNLPWEDNTLEDLVATFGNNVGIHLNLTKGLPLTSGLKTVVDSKGMFLPKKQIWVRAMFRRLDLHEIETEFTAQIAHLKEAGISPWHFDSNNHIHVFPGISEAVARVAKQFGISKIRLPMELFNLYRQSIKKGGLKRLFVGILSLRARPVFKRFGLCFTDNFAGIQYPCVSEVESLRSFVRNLHDGTTELMCHPGCSSFSGNPFSNKEREKELAALTHPSVVQDIKDCNIKLISYSDLN
jgi:predicted glycoside hydrolase/deacetylase ChbG (UPF0249 family)